MKRAKHVWTVVLGLGVLTASTARGEPLGTAFTYQAELNQGDSPLNGTADCRFDLFGVDSGGSPLVSPLTATNLTVTDGLVTLGLDFGVDVFDGSSRWLEVAIRSPHDPTDTAPFTTLGPRQPITAIPYALQTRGIFVDDAGNVGIGTTPLVKPAKKRGGFAFGRLHVNTADATAPAVFGETTATSGDAIGLKGATASPNGRGIEGTGPAEGIKGQATATVGTTTGVKGISDSTGGTGVAGLAPKEGVRGDATATSGIARGVCGLSASTSGEGVLGHAAAASGVTTGVKGMSDSTGGTGVAGLAPMEGVRGDATATSGIARGVCGLSASTSGEGVLGHAAAASGATTGVKGMSDSTGGTGVSGQAPSEGVHGEAMATSGTARGVCGVSPSTSGDGVFGHATASTGAADGVHGVTDSDAGRGVFGEATGIGTGVLGKAGPGGTGVRGETTGDTTSEGVLGEATSGTGPAIGVRGITASLDGAGMMGCAAGSSNCAMAPQMLGAGVFGYAPPSPPGDAAANGVAGWSDSGGGSGVTGSGLHIGVTGKPHGCCPGTVGVYGAVDETNGPSSYGVHGYAQIDDQNSAGVLAEGQGNVPPLGNMDAAALEIRNGAINVSGVSRPAGSIAITGPWSETVESCSTSGPGGHFHKVAHTLELEINNDLIVPNSIILLTVEVGAVSESQHSGYMAHVYDKSPGHAMVRVTAVTKYSGSSCPPPVDTVNRSVHYLIINPLP